METDLKSINTSQWTNIPHPLVQAINILCRTAISQSAILEGIHKGNWCSEITETITKNLESSKKIQESKTSSNISTTFTQLQEKLTSELTVFKKSIRDAFDQMTQELHNTKSQVSGYYKSFKTEVVSLREIVLSTKDSIKTELASKYIKPEQESIRLDFEELKKWIMSIEKEAKLLTLGLDRLIQSTNSRFDTHKEEIKVNERELATINKRFNYIVENTTETLKQNFESYSNSIEESMKTLKCSQMEFTDAFNRQREEMINVLEKRRHEMIIIHENTKETYDKLRKDQQTLFERCDFLERDSKFQLETFKIELKGILLAGYEETKEKVMSVYRDELKFIKSKLEWMPQTNKQISDMSPIEARLFILESRLRREENSRIVQKMEIMKGID